MWSSTSCSFVETLARLEAGTLQPTPQDHTRATLAPLLSREDGRMDFAAHTAIEIHNRWRGFQPWPGAFTTLNGKKLIVNRMAVAAPSANSPSKPGTISLENSRLFVACAQSTWLELQDVQLEGKKRLPAEEFLRGSQLKPGARLG